MIKYCTECKHSRIKTDPYNTLRCFNPLVNKDDTYMLASISGSGYGTDCTEQRRHKVFFWSTGCGINGRYWEPEL